MKRLLNRRWWILIVAVVLAGGIAGFVARWGEVVPWLAKSRFASELNSADPKYASVMCGPESLSVALGRLGVSVPSSEIASHCRVTSYGVALTELERIAAKVPGIEAVSRKLNWDELQEVDGVAILFVKANHYVVADSRESSNTRPGVAIRLYDQDVPARWYSRSELELIWSGETLVVMKQSAKSVAPDTATADWQECYIDKGLLHESAVANYKFSLCNTGSQPLLIEGVQKSCGCIRQKISAQRLAPQESAEIEVDVTLNGKEGYVQQYLIVKTNDPARRLSYLRMACGVPRKKPVSSQIIRLEDLPQGGASRHEFVVADSGFTGIKLREVSYRPRINMPTPGNLSCSISWEKVETESSEVTTRTGFPTSPGDYLVRLLFQSDDVCPVGPFEGTVEVTVEADDSVTAHHIEIQGTVVQDMHAIPQVALVTLGKDPDIAGHATIQLQSRTNREIVVAKVRSDGPCPLEVSSINDESGQHHYAVAARMPELQAGSAPISGTVHFELSNGSIISVPVSVFRPPLE